MTGGGYPGIAVESGGTYLTKRLGSAEYYAAELPASGKVIGKIPVFTPCS